MKTLFWDVNFYDAAPMLFLNGRFITGALGAVGLGAQGWLMRRVHAPAPPSGQTARPSRDRLDLGDVLMPTALLALTFVAVADGFWTLGHDAAWAWLLTSTLMVVAAAVAVLFSPVERTWRAPGLLLLALLPAKLILDVIVFADLLDSGLTGFLHAIFLGEVLVAAITAYLASSLPQRAPFRGMRAAASLSGFLNLFSLIALILVVTGELGRLSSEWGTTGITIWWAVCALALALFGLIKHTARHRYLGLVLFGVTLLKVFFVDLDNLDGLYRVGAFMGLGALLLLLSFVYQRLARRLAGDDAFEEEPPDD
jgi:uncharacterized membrane protein